MNKAPLLPTSRANAAATPREFVRNVPYVHSHPSADPTLDHQDGAPLAGTSPLWSARSAASRAQAALKRRKTAQWPTCQVTSGKPTEKRPKKQTNTKKETNNTGLRPAKPLPAQAYPLPALASPAAATGLMWQSRPDRHALLDLACRLRPPPHSPTQEQACKHAPYEPPASKAQPPTAYATI